VGDTYVELATFRGIAFMKAINMYGIRFKLLAYAAVLVAVMVVIAVSIAYTSMSGHVLGAEQQKLEQAAELSATQFAMRLGADRGRALVLANSPEVKGLVRARMNSGTDPIEELSEAQWNARLEQVFEEALAGDEAYRQASLIGLRNNGRELVRARNNGDSIAKASYQELESRAGEAVLLPAETLRPGETRIVSRTDGRSGDNSTIVFHAISGIFTPSGRVFGVISLDIDLRIMLDQIRQLNPEHPPTYVVEQNGRVLLGPGQEVASGFIYDTFPNIDQVQLSESGQSHFRVLPDTQNVGHALAIRRAAIGPGSSDASLSFIYSMPYKDFAAAAAPYERQIKITALIFVVVALAFAAHASRTIIRPLDQITDSIACHGSGKELANLPTGRKDQIGTLAREFERLLASLEVKQASLAGEVAERRLAESDTRASEARYKASLDLMRDAHFVADDHGMIQSVNRAGATMFGYATSELVGQNVSMLMPEKLQAVHGRYMSRYRATGEANIVGKGRDTDLFAARKDGSVFPISLLIEKFKTEEGSFLTAIVRDIAREQAIESENARLRTVVEHATDCIVLMSTDGVIEYVNPQFELDHGYTKAELLGKKAAEMGWRRSDSKIYAEALETVTGGDVWSGQLATEARNGSLLEQDVTISPVLDDAGRVVNLVYIIRNIGDKNQLERQLAQAQKLESIGQLAAGIAHEINTPTQYVGDNTRFIKDAFEDVGVLFTTLTELKESANGSVPAEAIEKAMEKADVEYLQDEVPRALDQSIEGVERVSKIVRAMKAFSHPAQDKTPVDLNAAIQSTVTVASNEWKYVAEIQTDFDPGLPLVTCLPGEFNQVILNMIVNAAHAIADVLGSEPAEKGSISVSTGVVDGWAEVRIADTGAGMPDDVKQRIFDPFFTTKDVGKGTGQGLNIAYTVVVEKHRGTIDVESTPGEGTCFTIRLPMYESSSADDTAAA